MTERLSRYHLAEQHDGRGWMILRLDALYTGFPVTARVVACNMAESDARVQLEDLRGAEVLEPDYPIELVDSELREAGGDPEAIGKRGAAVAAAALAKRRERAS